jgi:hypothetical protein
MNKSKLFHFTDLYYLGGLIESVKLTVKDNVLATSFVADDKSMAGTVSLAPFTFDDVEFGLTDTTQFRTMVKPLEAEITMSFNKVKDKVTSLSLLNADETGASLPLADLGVIPPVPKIKSLEEFDVEIVVDSAFMSKFISCKNALADVETFTLMMNKKDKLELIIGWSPSINTNRQTVTIKTVAGKDKVKAPISFNAKYLKEILSQNSDASGAVLKISEKGMAVISFVADVDGDKLSSTYYLIQKKLEA